MRGLAIVGACVLCAIEAPPYRSLQSLAVRQNRPARISANDNRTAAGTLKGSVLTLRLETREGEWRPDRDADPGLVVRAFAEEGKSLTAPGPLIRVPEG